MDTTVMQIDDVVMLAKLVKSKQSDVSMLVHVTRAFLASDVLGCSADEVSLIIKPHVGKSATVYNMKVAINHLYRLNAIRPVGKHSKRFVLTDEMKRLLL